MDIILLYIGTRHVPVVKMAPSFARCPFTVSVSGDTLITGLLLSLTAELSGSLTVELLLDVCCSGLILTCDIVLETVVFTKEVAMVTTGSPFTENDATMRKLRNFQNDYFFVLSEFFFFTITSLFLKNENALQGH